MNVRISTQRLKGTLCRYPQLFIHVALSSPMLYPVNADPGLPGLLVPSSQPRYIALFYLDSPALLLSLETLSRQEQWSELPYLFPISRRPTILRGIKFNVLKTVQCILPGFLAVSGRKVNLVLVIPCWSEADVFKLRFEAKQSDFRTWDHHCYPNFYEVIGTREFR